MAKQQIQTRGAPEPLGPYSQGIKAGGIIYVAGQVGLGPDGTPVGEGIEEQTERVIDNVAAILGAGGAGLADVVKTTVHLSDVALFAAFNEVYERRFGEPRPVRTTVGSQLPGGFLVEMDVVAHAAES